MTIQMPIPIQFSIGSTDKGWVGRKRREIYSARVACTRPFVFPQKALQQSGRIDGDTPRSLALPGPPTEAAVDDRRVIDINDYLGGSSPGQGRAFAVWGGEGDRARLALPIWRAIYLLGGDRGGIVWVSPEADCDPHPFFVLDLGEDPPRTAFSSQGLCRFVGQEAPVLASTPEGGITVYLGEEEGRRWFLSVEGRRDGRAPEGKAREDLLFLAGECAGLLFFRELSKAAE
jgi:hypothetical protein